MSTFYCLQFCCRHFDDRYFDCPQNLIFKINVKKWSENDFFQTRRAWQIRFRPRTSFSCTFPRCSTTCRSRIRTLARRWPTCSGHFPSLWITSSDFTSCDRLSKRGAQCCKIFATDSQGFFPFFLSSSFGLHFFPLFFLVRNPANWNDRHLLAHAMASDFPVAWQFYQREQFLLRIKLHTHDKNTLTSIICVGA
jgi:hypothetical protein